MIELYPCPFCGTIPSYDEDETIGSAVTCKVCKTDGPWAPAQESHISIKRWNERATQGVPIVRSVPRVDHPPLMDYMILLETPMDYMVLIENVGDGARALGVEGRFKKWCFRPVNGQWVTYQQLSEEQFNALLTSRTEGK